MFPERTFPCTHAMLESVYARILPSRGHEVQWIMRAVDHDPRHPLRQWHGSTIRTVPMEHGGPLVNTWTSLREVWQSHAFLTRLEAGRYDIVQVRNEIGPSLAAIRARRRGGFSFVYQLSWLAAEVRLLEAARGEMRPKVYHQARGRAERRARRRILRGADAVLAISDTMREELLQADDRLDRSRVMAFPLGFDSSVVPAASDVADVRARLGLDGRPTAVYFGTLSAIRRPEFLVDMLRLAHRQLPTLSFLVVGSGSGVESLKLSFASAGLGDAAIFTGQLSRQETAMHVAAAWVSVVPFLPVPELRVSTPTKLIESLGLGVPVVANEELPENAMVVRHSGGGELVPYDPAAFAEAVVRIASDPDLRRRQSDAGKAWVRVHRDYEVLATVVEDLYERLRGARPLRGSESLAGRS
jgi:glycosyltransferase involved in cell wall biosynthesis